MDILFANSTELLFLFCAGAALVTLGFMFGSQWVSEIALAVVVAHALLHFAPLSIFPYSFSYYLQLVGIVPADTIVFLFFVALGWWVAHSTLLSIDTVASVRRVLPATIGCLGLLFVTFSHTLTLGTLYQPGRIAESIFSEPLYALLFMIASLSLVGLSRKM